jgi:hypothetical protein
MSNFKFPKGASVEEKRGYIKPLLLRYYNENGKLDERGIDECNFLPSFYVIRNSIIEHNKYNDVKYDAKLYMTF